MAFVSTGQSNARTMRSRDVKLHIHVLTILTSPPPTVLAIWFAKFKWKPSESFQKYVKN